jgi:hypothetical protein
MKPHQGIELLAIDPGATFGTYSTQVNGHGWYNLPASKALEQERIIARHYRFGDREAPLDVLVEDMTRPADSKAERETLRLIGRVQEIFRADDAFTVHLISRTAVQRWLGARGDAGVRSALKARYGEDAFTKTWCPKRRNKGHDDDCPVCQGSGLAVHGVFGGMKGHAVQALGLADAWIHRPGECPCATCEARRPPLAETIAQVVVAESSGGQTSLTRVAIRRGLFKLHRLEVSDSRLKKELDAGVDGVFKRAGKYYREGWE